MDGGEPREAAPDASQPSNAPQQKRHNQRSQIPNDKDSDGYPCLGSVAPAGQGHDDGAAQGHDPYQAKIIALDKAAETGEQKPQSCASLPKGPTAAHPLSID